MNDISNRFSDACVFIKNAHGIKNNSDLAESLGISSSMMTEIIKGRSGIGVKILQNTVKYNINTNWLLTGEGSMLIGESVPTQNPDTGCAEKVKTLEEKLGYQERIISQQQDTIDSQKEVIAMLKEQLALAKNTDTKTPAISFSTKP